jgi:hypothetical protein
MSWSGHQERLLLKGSTTCGQPVSLAPDDAEAVAAGRERVVRASIAPSDGALHPAQSGSLDVPLAKALAAARTRGRLEKERMLTDSSMLNSSAIANLLGMSEEGVRQKRKRHEVLDLELAKRGIRYPAWQVIEGRQLLPAFPSCSTYSEVIRGGCSGSYGSTTANSTVIARSMPFGVAMSIASSPLPRIPLPAHILD